MSGPWHRRVADIDLPIGAFTSVYLHAVPPTSSNVKPMVYPPVGKLLHNHSNALDSAQANWVNHNRGAGFCSFKPCSKKHSRSPPGVGSTQQLSARNIPVRYLLIMNFAAGVSSLGRSFGRANEGPGRPLGRISSTGAVMTATLVRRISWMFNL